MSESLALAREVKHPHASMCAQKSVLITLCWHVRSKEHVAHKLACACTSEGCADQEPYHNTLPLQTYVCSTPLLLFISITAIESLTSHCPPQRSLLAIIGSNVGRPDSKMIQGQRRKR